jgi:hypothetical protein
MCHPLAAGFWFSEVKHMAIVTFPSAAELFRGIAGLRLLFCAQCVILESSLGTKRRSVCASHEQAWV